MSERVMRGIRQEIRAFMASKNIDPKLYRAFYKRVKNARKSR